MRNERNALLAAVISLLILVVWHMVVVPVFFPPPADVPPPAVGEEKQGRPAAPADSGAPPVDAGAPAVQGAATELTGRDIEVESDLYRAVFTTAGGRLKSFQLKHYRTHVQADSPPLEVILQAIPNDLPLGVELRSASGNISDAAVAYSADRERVVVSGGDAVLTLSGQLDGAVITKRVTFKPGTYLIGVDVRVERVPAGYVEMAVGWNKHVPPVPQDGQEVIFDTLLTLDARKMHTNKVSDVEKGMLFADGVQWVAYSGRYFLAAMAPTVDAEAGTNVRAWLKSRGDRVEAQILMPAGKFDSHLNVYIGPKVIDILEQAGHSLRKTVDLGIFSPLALIFLYVLKVLNPLTHNYGIDIILLTILVRILLYPFAQKSFQSMKAMQKLQPQMTELRERYKGKPEEMNRAVLELYKRHNVNPLSGCLPMIVQIPIFFGLNAALGSAIEFRHAAFIGWINDLSAPDRLGSFQIPFVHPAGFPVLTVLMGLSMFVQQKLSPPPTDPSQQTVLMLMPLMFTIMFVNLPSGLALYFLVSNILTIAQQYLINRSDSGKSG